MEVTFDDRGLVPVIVQDWRTGEVLMHAWANDEALERTRATGELHFWSRSRNELWHKGATSGNTLAVKALTPDCDGDTLLAEVVPAGPACHTGRRSCFFARENDPTRPEGPYAVLAGLERTLRARAAERPEGSYTAALLADPPRIGAKVREEADEVARAAAGESGERVAEEAADVVYHLLVLLRSRGIELEEVERVLDGRRR
jgi:phosphoribosyl-AMP cyclohydrolase / phosphoribosyl-ATP pyrophosphohydrolase